MRLPLWLRYRNNPLPLELKAYTARTNRIVSALTLLKVSAAVMPCSVSSAKSWGWITKLWITVTSRKTKSESNVPKSILSRPQTAITARVFPGLQSCSAAAPLYLCRKVLWKRAALPSKKRAMPLRKLQNIIMIRRWSIPGTWRVKMTGY